MTVTGGGAARIIAMKSQYIGAALFATCAVAIAIGASSIRAGGKYCPNSSASLAPCQIFDSSISNAVSRSQALQMGLLTPYLQPEPPTQLAFDRKSNADVW